MNKGLVLGICKNTYKPIRKDKEYKNQRANYINRQLRRGIAWGCSKVISNKEKENMIFHFIPVGKN